MQAHANQLFTLHAEAEAIRMSHRNSTMALNTGGMVAVFAPTVPRG